MSKRAKNSKSTVENTEAAREGAEMRKWRKIVGKVRTLADLGLTPTRAYGCHELTKECTSKTTPARFEERVASGKLRVIYWSFGLIVAVDDGAELDEIGQIFSMAYGQGGRGPLEVHNLGYVGHDGEFTDIVEMAGSDLTLPFTRTLLPVEVMDGQRGAL